MHVDLLVSRKTLAAAYRGATARHHAWSVLSSFILPVLYQIALTVGYGTLDTALHTLYRVQLDKVDTLVQRALVMNLAVAGLAYAYLWASLGKAPPAKRKA